MESQSGKLNNPGSFDPDFNSGQPQVFNYIDYVYAICPAFDDGIILMGNDKDQARFWRARLNGSGTLDTSFGERSDVFEGAPTLLNPVLLPLGEGDFLLVSNISAGLAIARYKKDGAPDTSFVGSGKLILKLDESTETLQPSGGSALAEVLPDGKYLLYRSNKVLRLTPTGVVDLSFPVLNESSAAVQSIQVFKEPDNRPGYLIYVAFIDRDRASCIGCFDHTGSLVKSFADDGYYRLAHPERKDTLLRALAVTGEGEIVVVGAVNAEFALVLKLGRDGKPAPGFNNGNPLEVREPRGLEFTHVEVSNDGLILAGGKLSTGGGWQTSVRFRFMPNGALDNRYGDAGSVIGSESIGVRGMFSQGTKLVVAGRSQDGKGGSVSRYL